MSTLIDKRKFSARHFTSSILADAKALRIPDGQAEEIAAQALAHIQKWLADRSIVTSDDIRRVTTKKLKTLHPELAYIYCSRGSII